MFLSLILVRVAETVLTYEDPTRGQLMATGLGTWAGLLNTDLGPIFFSKFVDFVLCFSIDNAACALSTVPFNIQIQAIFDSTILPLHIPAVDLDATTESGGFENSLTDLSPLKCSSVREA